MMHYCNPDATVHLEVRIKMNQDWSYAASHRKMALYARGFAHTRVMKIAPGPGEVYLLKGIHTIQAQFNSLHVFWACRTYGHGRSQFPRGLVNLIRLSLSGGLQFKQCFYVDSRICRTLSSNSDMETGF